MFEAGGTFTSPRLASATLMRDDRRMNGSIDLRLDRIASALPVLVGRLNQHGYRFARPTAVLPGPESTVDASIQRIESEIGAVPYAVAQFWRRIGSVDFCGSHPDWCGCDYPDPLVIDPASYAVAELQDFLDDREERMRYDFPFAIPISADDYHKENVSGGMWSNVDCPAAADDPIINDERHHMRFLDYLELALKMGGFLGLDECPHHNWPIQEMSIDLTQIR
jgi:hypothetical protein